MCSTHHETPILEGPAGQEYCPRCASVEVDPVDPFQHLGKLAKATREFLDGVLMDDRPSWMRLNEFNVVEILEEAEDYIESVVGA